MSKTIKIPQGNVKVLFENNGQYFETTDKAIWNALCEYIFKGDDEKDDTKFKAIAEKPDFDDEHPDYIRSSQEEI